MAFEVTLTEDAQLAPKSCLFNPVFSALHVVVAQRVTMSYANGPLDESGISIKTHLPLRLLAYVPGFGWIDLDMGDISGETTITVNQTTKTVTATSPFGPGVFVIGTL